MKGVSVRLILSRVPLIHFTRFELTSASKSQRA